MSGSISALSYLKFLELTPRYIPFGKRHLFFVRWDTEEIVVLRIINQQWLLQQRIRLAETSTFIRNYPQQLRQEVGSCVNKNLGTTQRIHISKYISTLILFQANSSRRSICDKISYNGKGQNQCNWDKEVCNENYTLNQNTFYQINPKAPRLSDSSPMNPFTWLG